ncbi:hypothetical protein [Kaarinaea lacus]
MLVLVGCSARDDFAGSCKNALLDDQSVICIDYYGNKNLDQWRTACTTAMRGEWAALACDTATSLGGCQAGNKIIWMYPSAKHATIGDAEQSCIAKNRKYLPVPIK